MEREEAGTSFTNFLLFYDNDNDHDYDGAGMGIEAVLNALDEHSLVELRSPFRGINNLNSF